MLYRLHADHEAEHRHEDLERSMLERAVEEETQRERERLDAAQVQLARTQAERANLHTLQEAGARRVLLDGHKEAGMEEVTLAACLSMLLLCLWQQHSLYYKCMSCCFPLQVYPLEAHTSSVASFPGFRSRKGEPGNEATSSGLTLYIYLKSEMYMLGVYSLFIC